MEQLATLTTLLILLTGFTAANTSIEVQKMSTEPSPLKVGQYADVQFKVVNTGSSDAENVSVEFLEKYPFSVDPDNTKKWRIASLEGGDAYQFRMQVRVDPNTLQGDEKLEFKTSSKRLSSRTHLLPVSVEADEDGLNVEKVEFPEKVVPGTSRTMNFTLENTANTYFRNIELSANPSAETPVVVLGTSKENVARIGPDESKTVSFRLAVDESADNGVYSIPVGLSYETEAGAKIQKDESTGIVVGGRPQIELGVNNGGTIPAGSTGTATLRFVNRGEGTAKFTKIEVESGEGYSILSGDSVYLGDMNPDDYQTTELNVHADKEADTAEIPVEITYQENEKEKTVTKTAEINVLNSTEQSLYTESGGSPILPAAVIIILLAAGGLYWRRRRKK
ncbi:MAG: COG1361 S-layer family protein [Candidatus Nanohalobium sp.]